jgi:hypothetical protein
LTRAKSGRNKRRISFLDVLSAVPFPSHAREAKPVERRDRSQSKAERAFCNPQLYIPSGSETVIMSSTIENG